MSRDRAQRLRKRNIVQAFIGGLLVALTLLPLSTVGAQGGSAAAAEASINVANLEFFLDDFLAVQMAELDVPGAVIVVVQDGEVAFAGGYGLADVDRKIPFDPERTIVRSGSIVKTLTATALMQLADRGEIDLDADVNQHLSSFQIPDTYSEPVTARQLLHYTAGFDSSFIGIRAPSESELLPLGDYLAQNLPARTRPPGTIRAYNDQEIALAGLLLEEISGLPFEEYLRENILNPLEMNSTSLVVPEEQADRLAIGYGANGPYPMNYYYLNNAPGAGFNTTAADMANFMIMHLQDGRFADRQILSHETAEEMHSTGFRHHESLPGIAHSFDEVLIGQQRFLMRSGGAPGFNNRMILLPEENTGVYFSYNRDSSVPLRQRLENELLERFFNVNENVRREPLLAPAAVSKSQASRYAGYYRELNDSSSTTIEKIQKFTNDVRVTANDDGSLNLFGDRLVEVEPGLFQWVDDGFFAAFEEDESGKVTHLFVARSAWQPVPWHETEPVQFAALGFALLAFLSGAIAWVIALVKQNAGSRLLTGLLSVLGLLFLIALVVIFMPVIGGVDPPWDLSFAPSPALLIVLAIPLLVAALIIAALIGNVRDWIKGQESRATRLHNSFIILGGLAFIFFLNTWNLLGYRL